MTPTFPFTIFPIDSKPFGLTYGEWSIKWWKWVLEIPRANNPMFDTTGEKSKIGQSNPNVLFMCQTYEEVDSIPNRSIKIPKGQAVFLPIINWVSILHQDGENDEELVKTARQRMDVVANLEIIIDGVPYIDKFREYRAKSPFFEINLPVDNVLGVSPGNKRAVSDGYWLLIKHISQSSTMTTFGSCSSGATKIGVNYNVLIE